MPSQQTERQSAGQALLDQIALDHPQVKDGLVDPSTPNEDMLTRYIQVEVLDVVQEYAQSDLTEAAQVASRALTRAQDEIAQVVDALSSLSSASTLAQALASADTAYYGGEMRLAEDLPEGERGDTLADYVAHTVRRIWSDPSTEPVMTCVHEFNNAQALLISCRGILDDIAQTHCPLARPKAA